MVTKKRVMGSLECRWRLRYILMISIAWALTAGLGEMNMRWVLANSRVPQATWPYHVITGTVLGISLVYHLVQYIRLVAGWQRYELCTAKLDEPVAPLWYRVHLIGFNVLFEAQGKYKILKTRGMWMARDRWIFPNYPLSEYNNRKVELLYDSQRERIIVLGFPEIRR